MSDFTASYVSGASDVPLLGHTIGHALDRAAAAWGTGRRWSRARRACVGPGAN
jgi:hypothetical protein